jgi:hypothetical protein
MSSGKSKVGPKNGMEKFPQGADEKLGLVKVNPMARTRDFHGPDPRKSPLHLTVNLGAQIGGVRPPYHQHRHLEIAKGVPTILVSALSHTFEDGLFSKSPVVRAIRKSLDI